MADRGSSLTTMPFARILPCAVAGIVVGNALPQLAWWTAAGATVVCAAAGWAWRRSDAGSLYTALSIFFFAMTMTYLTATRDVMPKGPRLVMTLRVDDNPQTDGRWTRATATVDKFRYYSPSADEEAMPADGSGWLRSGEKVVLRVDTAKRISSGDRLIVTGRASELGDENYAGYVRLMQRRGYSAALWAGQHERMITLPGKARSPMYFAGRMQLAAQERLSRLPLEHSASRVAAAMSIGNRQGLDRRVREEYSLSGASHLLAVSGLHVGIVAMLVNALLYLLPLLRRGHIVKNIVAVAVIWLYAMLAGLSPSVVRAAMMFTGVQFALASSRPGNGLNIILGTGTLMLLLNPNYLYDVSFQLSFAAVLGIFLFYGPLYSQVRTRFRAVNALWSVFIVGAVATIATAPLAAYHFGRIPLIGILMNPIVIVAANVTVQMSLLWIILPLPLLGGFFSAVIGFSAGLQNRIVEFCATLGWGSVSVDISAWQALAAYVVILAAWLPVRRYLERPVPSSAEGLRRNPDSTYPDRT